MRKFLKVFAWLLTLTAIFCITLALFWSESKSPEALTHLMRWFDRTWVVWLIWRLVIYAVTAYFAYQCWQLKKADPAWRRMILRICSIGTLYIVVMEWALYSSTGGH